MAERPYPFLATAYLRIKRAAEHLNDIERRIVDFWRQTRDQKILFSLNAETNKLSVKPPVDLTGLPAMIGLLAGETVYNLRSALDYLVFDLALFNSGAEQDDTQFLIEDSPDRFRRKVSRRLSGLTVEQIAAVERCRPYPTRDDRWLARLRDISNTDKHRQWTAVAQTIEGSVFWKAADRGTFGTVERGEIYRTVFSDGREMDVNVYGDLAVEITLDDGTPIIETLDEFIEKTKSLLDTFQPEFKGFAAGMVRVHDSSPPQASSGSSEP